MFRAIICKRLIRPSSTSICAFTSDVKPTTSAANPAPPPHSKELEKSLKKETASTVVIGGGVVGTSIAYHLAKQGEKDVVLLEKSELTAGSTWHAAGLTTSYHPLINLKKIHYNSLNFYAKIAGETGQEIGFHQPGSVRIATTPERVNEFKYQMSRAGSQDAPQHLLNPKEVKKLIPLIDEEKILMGLYNPYDGHLDPYSLTQAIAKGARRFGATILQGVEVTSLHLKEDGSWIIGTPQGEIKAEKVVNAAGFWAKDVGKLAGRSYPLVPIHHQYLVTSSVPEIQSLKTEFPVIRLLEASCYVRQEREGFLIGPYESPETMKMSDDWSRNGVPRNFGKELFPPDIDRMTPYLEMTMELIPSFANASIQSIVHGPITYTADLLPMIGPDVLPNMWIAAGFGYGIIHGGGVGKFMADWIQNGEPTHDLTECDPGRFSTWTSEEFTFTKARESYGMNNSLGYPFEERFAGRPTSRVTSAYDRQKQRGAWMKFDYGWEHPSWFAPEGEEPKYIPTFGRTNWHSAVHHEWERVKTAVGVIDLSPFGKFILEGPQAADFMGHVTANKVPDIGRVVVTHLLTPQARVSAEVTCTRTALNQFFIITGAGSEIHDLRWMKEIARAEGWKVEFTNASDELGCLSVAGPKAKDVLSKLNPRFQEKFPYFSSDKVTINDVETTAMRLSYTGELGWELYHPKHQTGTLYDLILEAGEEYGIGDFGSLALNVLRLEKGFKMWGKEMNHDRNMFEAGLLSFVDLGKKDFIGKSALLNLMKEIPRRELVMIKIDPQAEIDPLGDETLWVGNKVVGSTTSGCFSYFLNQPLAFAYLSPFLCSPGTTIEVELLGERYTAEVLSKPPDMTFNEKLAEIRKKKQ